MGSSLLEFLLNIVEYIHRFINIYTELCAELYTDFYTEVFLILLIFLIVLWCYLNCDMYCDKKPFTLEIYWCLWCVMHCDVYFVCDIWLELLFSGVTHWKFFCTIIHNNILVFKECDVLWCDNLSVMWYVLWYLLSFKELKLSYNST